MYPFFFCRKNAVKNIGNATRGKWKNKNLIYPVTRLAVNLRHQYFVNDFCVLKKDTTYLWYTKNVTNFQKSITKNLLRARINVHIFFPCTSFFYTRLQRQYFLRGFKKCRQRRNASSKKEKMIIIKFRYFVEEHNTRPCAGKLSFVTANKKIQYRRVAKTVALLGIRVMKGRRRK